MIKKKEVIYRGTGKRKSSIAQIILTPSKKGNIIINNKLALDFFPYVKLIKDLEQPLKITNSKLYFDINVKVSGGGFTGQAGATRLGIARALIKVSKDYKNLLKHTGMLTRDSRIKERKKYGLHGARKAPQYSKR